MPIFTQCENGHRLQVETALAGKRIRCKKCGSTFIVPELPAVVQPPGIDQSPIGRPNEPRSVKGELIPLDFPELKPPKPKSRVTAWHPSQDEDLDDDDFHHTERSRHDERRKSFDRGDFEKIDFLFQHHPQPVSRKYSIPTSVAILLLPIVIYAGLRFGVASIPSSYLADVKRLAVQRANHESVSREHRHNQGTAAQRDQPKSLGADTGHDDFLIRDVCLGCGGRYFITYHAPIRLSDGGGYVTVQDLQRREVIGTIGVEGPHISLAASRDTLVIGGWGSASIQAYQLPSLQLIQEKLVTPETAPISLAMGHSSYGPLYVINSQSQLEIRELSDLEEVSLEDDLEKARLLFDKRSLCNASADGQTFCGQGSHLNVVQYARGRVRGEGQSTVFASDHVAPTLSSDGKLIFTPRGVYSSSLAVYDFQRRSCLAAATGPFFVGPSTRSETELNKLWLYVADQDEPIAEIPKEIASPLAVARNSFATQTLTNDKRLVLIPSQNCIVSIAPESNQVIIHDFDFDAALTQAGLKVPYISPVPIPTATRGQTLVHQIETKGFESPSFRLALGPSTMRIDQDGVIRWSCNQPDGTIHPVIVDVIEGPLRATQSFQVRVGGPIIASRASQTKNWSAAGKQSSEPTTTSDGIAKNIERISRTDLPGIARQPTLAGGGRFLILRLLEIDSLAVVDLLDPHAVRYLPISPSSVFAASKSVIVTLDLQKDRLERFDLRTLRSLGSGEFPNPNRVGETMLAPPMDTVINDTSTQIARLLMRDGESKTSRVHHVQLSMGFRSDGPLLYSDQRQGFFMDAEQFQRLGSAAENADCRSLLSSRWGFEMMPAGDAFVGEYDYESPTELRGGHFDGKTISYHTPMTFPSSQNEAYPGMLFVEDTFQAAVTKQVTLGIGVDRHQHLAIPSADQSGYVAVELRENESTQQTTTDIYLYNDAEFHKPSERRKLITLSRKDFEPPLTDRREYRGFVPWNRRLIYLPDLGRLVTLPSIGNRVVVVRLDETQQQYAATETLHSDGKGDKTVLFGSTQSAPRKTDGLLIGAPK